MWLKLFTIEVWTGHHSSKMRKDPMKSEMILDRTDLSSYLAAMGQRLKYLGKNLLAYQAMDNGNLDSEGLESLGAFLCQESARITFIRANLCDSCSMEDVVEKVSSLRFDKGRRPEEGSSHTVREKAGWSYSYRRTRTFNVCGSLRSPRTFNVRIFTICGSLRSPRIFSLAWFERWEGL